MFPRQGPIATELLNSRLQMLSIFTPRPQTNVSHSTIMGPKKASGSVDKPRSKSSPPTGLKAIYLILYNSISALLWTVVLGRTVLIAARYGTSNVYTGAGEFTKWTQTLAGLEVLHAAIGNSSSTTPFSSTVTTS